MNTGDCVFAMTRMTIRTGWPVEPELVNGSVDLNFGGRLGRVADATRPLELPGQLSLVVLR